MTRPTPHSERPYSRGTVSSMTGVGVPTIKNLVRGVRKLKRKHRGTGNWDGFSFDDSLRIGLSKELLRVGVPVATISELFDVIEQPRERVNKGWAWLRTPEARQQGAALVLILGHPLGPDPATTGHCYLTTAYEAVAQMSGSKGRTVIVIDVNAIIARLEDATGERYQAQPTEPQVSDGQH
jgi:hypothetical protein